jgi:succinate dehydrogenase / fumarate reductase flavoprotein subunit
MLAYAKGLKRAAADAANGFVEHQRKRQADVYERIYRMDGRENPYAIWRELGEWMTQHVTVERYNKNLKRTDDKIVELKDRWGRIGLNDRGRWLNQEVSFVRQLWNMLELARVITLGALARDESRGAHYKPDFPQRDDAKFLKTTKARWTSDGPELSYEDVDVSLIRPRVRKYDTEKSVSA